MNLVYEFFEEFSFSDDFFKLKATLVSMIYWRTDAYMKSVLTFSLDYCINHGAVPLFSNRSGMKSKCGENRKVAHSR